MKKNKYGGINDMYRGWISENNDNKRIYDTWWSMLRRCYETKYHETHPTYKDCYVCDRWLKLSNFVEDVPKIKNYKLWYNNTEKFKYQLDKDIKSDGKNKCYCLEECQFVLIDENIRQSCKTKDYKKTTSKICKPVCQFDKNMNLINIFNSIKDAQLKTNISHSSINVVCQFWEINCDKNKWIDKHKSRPCKYTGGFIFKYLSDVSDDDLIKYLIKMIINNYY